jgi:hypothetical protein
MDFVYILHFLFVGPLLIYVGYYKDKVPTQLFNVLIFLGAVVLVYHLYRFIQSMYYKSKVKVV